MIKKIKALLFSIDKGIFEFIFNEKISDEDFRDFLEK